MARVAGVDGAPGGWAVVIKDGPKTLVRKILLLADLLDGENDFDIVAVDVPIGLIDAYEVGGRPCDRAARQFLGRRRASSVFPAPVRSVLTANSWEEACSLSRASAPQGKAISKQAFCILSKIREVDDLLRERFDLRDIVREVHPEVCFSELVGRPLINRKASRQGREERRQALMQPFPDLQLIETSGRAQGLPIEDILDATVACWSALRIANGRGRSLPDVISCDNFGLQMAIWV
jgi:predicted RNase H-like nuclease